MHSIPDSAFRKSSYSHPRGNDCVEVADLPIGSAVRDTQHRELGHLLFGAKEWAAFVAEVKHDG
ncbi:DUF397 domain-containing protein [Nocardiopsis sp. CNT-189]|uniref:DUF397 domain-containing protein n=1 Tax=Nocardiopsis oceanisediminis TaxID=2816862 RepID=UPI003B2A27D8